MSNKYKVVVNTCKCHPETCNCNDWAILYGKDKFCTIFDKEKADLIAKALNLYEANDCEHEWVGLFNDEEVYRCSKCDALHVQ